MNISRKMAKNKTDEPVFVEPEFNEREYIVEEKERAKTTVFVFILGILSGLLEGFLEMNGLYYLSILLFILTLLGLFKILPLLKLRIPTRNSHKFYLFMMVLLTSILFWSVALNPPISVNTQPSLSLQQYSSNSWISVNQSGGNYVLPVSSTHSNFSLRDGIYFANTINAVSFTSSNSNVIINSHFSGGYEYMNITGLPNGSSLVLSFDITSGSNHYTETQTIYFS